MNAFGDDDEDFDDEDFDDEDFDDEDFDDEDDFEEDDFEEDEDADEGVEPPGAAVSFARRPDQLEPWGDEDAAESAAAGVREVLRGMPVLGKLDPFERETFEAEEVSTPPGLLFELKQFLAGKPIAYDPCSCPWATTRALHANMLKQYRPAQIKLSTEELQRARYQHNFPGRVTFGDGLLRPFPAEGLTYVFPGFKAQKTQQWLKKVRTESIAQRVDPDKPRVIQNGNELPFAGEIIMLVSLEHMARPWFDYVWAADAVCFLREPLWFGGADARSTVGSVLVYYGYRRGRFRRAFAGAGRVMRRGDIKYTGPRSLTLFAPPQPTEERLVKQPKPKKPTKEKK